MTYEQWMKAVDRELQSLIGLTQDDLPDWLSRDAYEEGLLPPEAAIQCLEDAGMDPENLEDEY